MIINPLNFEKLIFNPEVLLKIKNKEPFFPLHMIISLTNYCNHKCIWCSAYEYQQGKAIFFDTNKLINFLTEAAALGLKAITYIGKGEPTLHPDFGSIVKRVNMLGIEQGIFTNGTHIDLYADQYIDYFSFVRFSLDAFDNESHFKTHGVKNHFSEIIENMTTLSGKRRKRLPNIGIQFVYHNFNYEGILKITKIGKSSGMDYISFKPAFNLGATDYRGKKNTLNLNDLTDVINDAKLQFEDDQFRIFFRDFQLKSLEKSIFEYDICSAGIFNLSLFEDERIYICAYQKVAVGTINNTPQEIIESVYRMKSVLNLKKCPGGCRYHSLNRLIYLLMNETQREFMNVNFI